MVSTDERSVRATSDMVAAERSITPPRPWREECKMTDGDGGTGYFLSPSSPPSAELLPGEKPPHAPPCVREGARGLLSFVIPNHKGALFSKRALVCEGSPHFCILSLAGGFLTSLTSPRWGSCAASSKCSCKQAFLLASFGSSLGEGALCFLRLPSLCKGGCRAERGGRVVKERGMCRQ